MVKIQISLHVYAFVSSGTDTGRQLSNLFCIPSEKGSTLKGKNLLPLRNPFQKGLQSQKFAHKEWQKIYQVMYQTLQNCNKQLHIHSEMSLPNTAVGDQ